MKVAQSPVRFRKSVKASELEEEMATDASRMIAAAVNTSIERGDVKATKFWIPDSDPKILWRLVDAEPGMEVSVAHAHDATHDLDLDDVCDMGDLHEAPLLALLKRRWKDDKIYTSAGNVLISINPYRDDGKEITEGPRLELWSQRAYDAMCSDGKNQAIVVNGESGAGKTTATALIVEYLARGTEGQVSKCLLATTPVLEAFGNAQTAMNDNSSRFGKYVVVEYQRERLVGARLRDFLLEKSRVTTSGGPNERNFHWFYQVFKERRESSREAHAYLNEGKRTYESSIQATEDGLKILGMDPSDDMLRRVAIACVRLGDIEFEDEFDDGEEQAALTNQQALEDAATALRVDKDDLYEKLLTRVIVISGETKVIAYTALQARSARDAFAKALYEKAFEFVVATCNDALEDASAKLQQNYRKESIGDEEETRSVGILDIYGFEIFEENTLDQLLINYANESLQVAFNVEVLVAETLRYEQEGIDWKGIQLQDSRACLELVDGVLVQLDEQVKLGQRGSDSHFLGVCDRIYKENEFYSKPRFNADQGFIVSHYAGDVLYTADGFLKRNVDPLSNDLADLVRSSSDAEIKTWYPAPPAGESGRQAQRRLLNESTSKKFRDQMSALTVELASCAKHYVRCVRPNANKSPDLFDADLVLRQLRFFGILDIVRIRRLGFPERVSLKAFWDSYSRLVPTHPEDSRWVAFRKLLPSGVVRDEAGGLYPAWRERLPETWRDWLSQREPILKKIDELEEERTRAAKINDNERVQDLSRQIETHKNMPLPRPPDYETAVGALCSILLAQDEFAVGNVQHDSSHKKLYTKLGVTRRLDEMLALAMGVETSLAKARSDELSKFASDRVNAEAAATILVQNAARARKARAALETRRMRKIQDEKDAACRARHDAVSKALDDLAHRHVKTCELVDVEELQDNVLVAKLDAARACLDERTTISGSSPTDPRFVRELESLRDRAKPLVVGAEGAALDAALAKQRRRLSDLQRRFDAAAARADALVSSPFSVDESARTVAGGLLDGIRRELHRLNTVAAGEFESAETGVSHFEAVVFACTAKSFEDKREALERRHAAVGVEVARSPSNDDALRASALAQDRLVAAKKLVDELLEGDGTLSEAEDSLSSAEAAVRAEEDLFEATARARALADLEECKRRRISLAERSEVAGVASLPEVFQGLKLVDSALDRRRYAKTAAELGSVAKTANRQTDDLQLVVERCVTTAKVATRMEATMRAKKQRKEYLAHLAAATRLEAAARGLARQRSMKRKKKKVVVIERAVRGFEARRRFARELDAHRHNAALRVQTWWRCATASWCLRYVRELTRPWRAVLPSRAEYVAVSTVAVWHKYARAGRVGEVVGSRKVNVIVTNRGNVVLASGYGVSAYAPDETPAVVKILKAGSVSISLKDVGGGQPQFGRELPIVVVEPNRPLRRLPACKFELKVKKGLRTSAMRLTDIAGTSERWAFLKDVFEKKDMSVLTPKKVAALNLYLSIANLPIDKCGRLFKQPFKRRGGGTHDDAENSPPSRPPNKKTTATKVSSAVETAVKHEEKERFFILQGGVLRYYKHEADDYPKGQLCLPVVQGIPSQAKIDVDAEDGGHRFHVKTAVFPDGISVRAHDADELQSWLDAIDANVVTDLYAHAKMISRQKSYI